MNELAGLGLRRDANVTVTTSAVEKNELARCRQVAM
jgi:hypothetical protein